MELKHLPVFVLAVMAAHAASANDSSKTESHLSFEGIPHREVKTTHVNTELRTVDNRITPIDLIGKKGSTNSTSHIEKLMKTRAKDGQECLDSIIRVTLGGTPVSKQSFQFNKSGLPTICNSYLPIYATGEWELFSTYEIAYDDLDRMILKASTNYEDHYSDVKYEYTYSDNSPYYNTETVYFVEDNEFVPYQKGEYTYDANGNPTEQIFEYYDIYNQQWIKVYKETATWDKENRQTSYFYYIWDENTGDWEGSIMNGNCEEYFYTPSGNDALIKGYVWEDGKWFNFQQIEYTYNSQDLCIKDETKYWNRSKNDWSGSETWGPFEQVYVNQYGTNEYDEDGRLVLQHLYSVNSEGVETLTLVFTADYKDLGEGNTEIHQILNLRLAADEPPIPWTETISRRNKWGSEYYYLGYSYSNGVAVPMSEDVRHMDAYNNYLGGEFYGFNAEGIRYGQSKEEYTYPANFDPSLQQQTPSEGIHWTGTSTDSDDTWAFRSRDTFTWTEGYPVMSGSTNYMPSEEGEECPTNAFYINYDTSVLMEGNILFWIDYNKRDNFYYYKINSSTETVNYDFAAGETEWNPDQSYTDTYYYGVFDITSVDNNLVDPNAVEVARYNASGVRLDAPVKGLNIIMYSDGTVRKEFVTK